MPVGSRVHRTVLAATLLIGVAGVGACAPETADAPQTNQATHRPAVTRKAAASASPSPSRTTARAVPSRRATQSHAKPRAGSALALLSTLAVKGRGPMTGYDRDRFGQPWLDADRNGCDTRNDVLRRDLVGRTLKPGTRGCVVLAGTLPDPYTASDLAFERGYGNGVDIDHVVALGNAWVTGAAGWDIRRRAALANDPLNLLAVDMHTNRQKGDGDAATWLPPARAYRCAYVARQVTVKAKYDLAVTAPERDAIRRVLGACPGQPVTLDPTHAPTRVDHNLLEPGPASSPVTTGHSHDGPGVSYANCDAVRAAGRAPIHAGDPGYSRSLDRDGDGTGCE